MTLAVPAEVTVLCEGVPQGPDVRLLERARWKLEQQGAFPAWIRVVKFVPAGGKGELAGELRARRRIAATQRIRVAAIRDRDFLRLAERDQYRADAVQATGSKAWPLSRHSVESYLIEPPLLASVGLSHVQARVRALADARRWYDMARSSVQVVRVLVNEQRPSISDPLTAVTSRDEAVAAAKRAIAAWHQRMEPIVAGEAATIETEIDADVRDFALDPVEHRVDGKQLLAAVAQDAGRTSLADDLLRHVEQDDPPQALVDDVRQFLQELESTF